MKKQYQLIKRLSLLAFFFLLTTGSLMAQENFKVSGKVTDAKDGTPLVGVTVSVKGTQQASITNYDGTFTMQTSSTATLVFSYVGYTKQEVPVNGTASFKIALEPTTNVLGEIVVVGYGTVRKTDATGSITAVSSKDFNKGAITSPQDLLVGKSTGVVITNSGGAPGANATIRIRGGSSLNASNDPLIVIDGVAIDNKSIPGLENPLTTINPNDIESFTVLKDASSTAIYGSRASNGVIIITTKKGKEGKMELTYNGSASVSSAPKFMDVFTGDEYRALAKKLLASGLSGLSASALTRLGTANTNWQKEIYRTAISQDHSLSASGSYMNTPYRVSIGFTDNNGILKTTNLKRNTMAIALDPTFFDNHLKVSLNLKGVYTKENFGNSGAIGGATNFDPTQPVMNGNTAWGGYFTWADLTANLPNGSMDPNGHPNGIGPSNPVAQLNQTDNTSNVYRSIGNLNLDYKLHFLPDLSAKLNLGYDYYDSKGHNYQPTNAAFTVAGGTGYKNDYSGKGKTQLLNFNLQYIKDLPTLKSKLDVLAGYEWSHFWSTSYNWTKSSTTTNDPQNFPTEHFLVSFLGRLNYTLMDKYLLTVTLRDDNSSRFAQSHREGLFPSAALAWKIKEESFLKDVSVISEFKLRLGYGVTGQENIPGGDYPYMPVYRLSTSTAQYQFGNTFISTYRPDPYDANIKWESTITKNIGLDFGFFNSKLTGSIDAYKRTTNDLIANIPIASGSNFSNFLITNVGNLDNNGVELSLNAQVIAKKDMSWNLGFNFSYNENKITKLSKTNDPNAGYAPTTSVINGGVGNYIEFIAPGYPNNSFSVFQQVYGLNGMPIEGLYVDRSGLGGVVTSNNANKYHYKQPAPDQTIGISSRFTYEKFDFSFAGRASIGNYVYNNYASSQASYGNLYSQSGFFSNIPKQVLNTGFKTLQYFSDYYVENASFFRMDNISLGYNFGEILGQKLKARLSFTCQNAFVITKYKGLDPEVANGIDNNVYPRPRVFLLGVNLTF